MCMSNMGARQGGESLYRHHNLYQNIGGSSGLSEHAQYTKLCIRTMGGSSAMCEHTQYTTLCIITLGARPGCASIHKPPNYV